VLFVNGDAFGELSEAQQAILGEAAAAAQKKAIAEHPSEVEAATTWCSDFGTIVLASDEQIAEFEEAAQPVFDWIEQDPRNAELVAAIRELKANTPASPAVEACEYALAQQMPTSEAGDETWSTGLPPNGVWQVTLTNDDVIQKGVSPGKAPEWSGVYTLTIQDSNYTWAWLGTEDFAKGDTGSCKGLIDLVDDTVRVTYIGGDDCDAGEKDIFKWRIDDQGLLHFYLTYALPSILIEIKAAYEAKPYQNIADQ
jgi:hypothetical protein